MPFVEVKQSGPDIPDGVYPVVLTAIEGDPEIPNAPRHVVPESGPNAGKDLYFWDWKFAIDTPGHPLDATEIEYGTSTATGPRSKMYGVLTALLNGTRPTVGMTFEKTDLIGRRALATIQRDDAGYCRITNLGAMPASMQQQAFAQATGVPVQQPGGPAPQAAAAQPLRDQVAQAAPAAPQPVQAAPQPPQQPAYPDGQFVAPPGGFAQPPASQPAQAVAQQPASNTNVPF